MKRLIHLAIAIVLIVSAVGALGVLTPTRAAAQCAVRTDWTTYVVVRGDTLFSIARRFNTNIAVVAQGNCLINVNRLYVGQTLRVPPAVNSGGWHYPAPVGSISVGATYQLFQNGFMTWRVDYGEIRVYLFNGRSYRYPLNVYGGLSNGRRYYETLPPGTNLPSNGFKTVFDNFNEVHSAIGWAIGGEQGYLMVVQPSASGTLTSVPDGRFILVNSYGGWQYVDGSLPPAPQPTPQPTPVPSTGTIDFTTGATYQHFEHGFMIWRADTGEIWVYTGGLETGSTGEMLMFANAQYTYYPDTPYVPARSETWAAVRFGFGKMWNYMPGIRARLGYAITNEQGYTAAIEVRSYSPVSLTLPDGRAVIANGSGGWIIA